MIIKSIAIKRLKAIREERVLEFAPGLNIIKGSDNEVGKSSTRIAITKALFEDPASLPEGNIDLTSWGMEDPWEITLEFEDKTGHYRITRSLKDKTSELVGTGAREFVARNKNSISEKITEITGCPSEAFFLSTACISQDEMIRIVPQYALENTPEGIGAINKRLQAKLNGMEDGVDIPALLSGLYNQANYKEAGGPYYQLQETKERIYRLREQILEETRKVNDIMARRRRLSRVKAELEEIHLRLPEKLELIEKNRKIASLEKDIARDKARYEAYLTAAGYHSRLEYLKNELAPFSNFDGAAEKIRRIESLRESINLLTRQIDSLEHDIQVHEKQKPVTWIPALALFLMVWGIAGGAMVNNYLWSVAVIGLVFFSYWLSLRHTWNKHTRQMSARKSELDAQLWEMEDEQRTILNSFECEDYDDYYQRLMKYRSLMESQKDLAGKLEAIINGHDWQAFVTENESLALQTGVQIRELEQLASARLDSPALQKLESEVQEIQHSINALKQEEGGLENYFLYIDIYKDSLTDIEEELEQLDREREFWERKRKVYKAAHEILEEAYKQTLSRAADLLEKEIGRYIAIITSNRYNQVRVNEADMSLSTFSPEKGDWVDVALLSRGTQDQFYICARFALAKLITEGKRPPLLLDDPFVNFHARRLRQAVCLLKEIARENQVLLFTCSDAYDYLGHVISLD